MPQKMPTEVATKLKTAPADLQPSLLALRKTIFDAAESASVGEIIETLKWGEISYLPKKPRIGTTIRLGWSEDPPQVRFFVHCQTRLLDIYRDRFPTDFRYAGNRAVHIDVDELSKPAVRELAAIALTYHRDKLGVA